MASGVVVRLAEVTDADAVADVHRRSRAAYYGVSPDQHDGREAMWSALMEQPDRSTYLAESGDTLGFVSMAWTGSESRVLELSALYVLPDRFGVGVGSLLYERFNRERGSAPAVLEVWAGNSRAIEFYERRGWVPTGTTRPGPQDHPFVEHVLAHPDAQE